MPRPVVPSFLSPRRSSRARSSSPCEGRIRAALSATFRVFGEMSSPFLRIVSISATRAQCSTTTPLPMIDNLPGRTTPDGSRLRRYSTLPTTRVWPALWPPWKRTTISARSDSQSTILPLPSSPHWVPTTATLPISASRRDRPAVLQDVIAAEPPRLRVPIRRRRQRGDGHPALRAQRRRTRPVGAERQQQPARGRRLGQGAQDRVGVEGKAGRRLGRRRVAGLIAAAAAELAERRAAGEEAEADAAVVLEAAVLDRIDGDLERRQRRRQPVEHRAEPVALRPRRLRQGKPVERAPRRRRRPRRRDQPRQQRPDLARQQRDRGHVLVVERGA